MTLRLDLKRKQQLHTGSGSSPSMLKVFFSDGTSANCLYRGMRWCVRHRLVPLAFVLQVLNKWMNQCVIGLNAEFGPGLVLAHPVGIIINSRVRGGSGIVIESAVVIGDAKGQSPCLGDEIYIGAGAKIIGDVSIGSNVRIGANAVVVTDIPDGATAVGIPARVVRQRCEKSVAAVRLVK